MSRSFAAPASVRCSYLARSPATKLAKSDVDIFFDLERQQGFTLFDLVTLQERMQAILGAKVDLMTRNGIHPRRRPRIEAAAVRVF